MRIQSYITIFRLVILTAFLHTGCAQWDLDEINFPKAVNGGSSPGPVVTEMFMEGTIEGMLPDVLVEDHGHVWSISELEPTISNIDEDNGDGFSENGRQGNGSFTSEGFDLVPNKTYHYRSYVRFNGDFFYSEQVNTFMIDTLNIEITLDNLTVELIENTFEIDVDLTYANLPQGILLDSYGIVWGNDSIIDKNRTNNVRQEFNRPITDPSFEDFFFFEFDSIDFFIRPFVEISGEVFYGKSFPVQFVDIWFAQKAFGGGSRRGAVGFEMNGKGYVGLGLNFLNNPKNDFYEFDPIANTWKQLADFPGDPRLEAVGFGLNGKAYVGLGKKDNNFESFNTYYPDFYEFTPNGGKGSWRRINDFLGGERSNAAGFSMNEKGYVGLGFDGTNNRQDFYEFDPTTTDNWEVKSDFPGLERRDVIAFSIELAPGIFRGYVGLGTDGTQEFSDLYEFDPASNWTNTNFAEFEEGPIFNSTAFSIGGKGYVGTGSGFDNGFFSINNFFEFDPNNPSNPWNEVNPFRGGHINNAVSFSIGDKGYLGTGTDETNQPKSFFWEYVPN